VYFIHKYIGTPTGKIVFPPYERAHYMRCWRECA
jgi:hypothetical protein